MSFEYAKGSPFITVIKPIFAPKIRPIFALTNSAASGFFFWGIIEEPVENLSDNSINLNCAEDHITSSSANRLKCIAQIEEEAKNSKAKSRSLTASREFAVGLANLSLLDV